MQDFDRWYIGGEYGNGVELMCSHATCEWTYTHPYVSAQMRELRLIAQTHEQEAHQ